MGKNEVKKALRMGGIYRPGESKDKDELFLYISAKHQTFGHFCRRSVYCFIKRFLGQIEHLVVPSRTFGVPFDIHTRRVGCNF
jgi:hypothetical protein